MEIIKNKYHNLCNNTSFEDSSDIYQHLPTLFKYASECNSVFETGVRGCVSSWAFLYGLLNNNNNIQKEYLLNDINVCDITNLMNIAQEFSNIIKINYIWKNNLTIELPQNYDITFIDTWHVYGQLKRELKLFSKYTNKYIIMHDTTIDEIIGESIRNKWNCIEQSKLTGIPVNEIEMGLWPAICEFLNDNPEWKLKERYTNNNGLTILERIK